MGDALEAVLRLLNCLKVINVVCFHLISTKKVRKNNGDREKKEKQRVTVKAARENFIFLYIFKG